MSKIISGILLLVLSVSSSASVIDIDANALVYEFLPSDLQKPVAADRGRLSIKADSDQNTVKVLVLKSSLFSFSWFGSSPPFQFLGRHVFLDVPDFSIGTTATGGHLAFFEATAYAKAEESISGFDDLHSFVFFVEFEEQVVFKVESYVNKAWSVPEPSSLLLLIAGILVCSFSSFPLMQKAKHLVRDWRSCFSSTPFPEINWLAK